MSNTGIGIQYSNRGLYIINICPMHEFLRIRRMYNSHDDSSLMPRPAPCSHSSSSLMPALLEAYVSFSLYQSRGSKPAHSSLSIFFASASGVKTAGVGAGLVSLSVLSAPVLAGAQGWTPFASVHVSVVD